MSAAILPQESIFGQMTMTLHRDAQPDQDKRNVLVMAMRIRGMTLLEIGKSVGLTRERVRQIIEEERRRD